MTFNLFDRLDVLDETKVSMQAGGQMTVAATSEELQLLTAEGMVCDAIGSIDVGLTKDLEVINGRWFDLALGQKGDHPTGISQLQA